MLDSGPCDEPRSWGTQPPHMRLTTRRAPEDARTAPPAAATHPPNHTRANPRPAPHTLDNHPPPYEDRVVERLLERETELEMLDGVIEQAVDGHGALVLVGGEAGAGKTSLTRAVRTRSAGRAAFLTGSCEPLSVPVPLAPIRELFDAAGGLPKDVGSAD